MKLGDLFIRFKAGLKILEPFFAIGIFIFLMVIGILLYQEHKITSGIEENCGWGEDDYYCVCEKNMAQEMRYAMENKENISFTMGFNLSNVSLVE